MKISNKDYHSRSEIGSTQLGCLYSKPPAVFKQKFMQAEPEEKACYVLGSAFHTKYLEPLQFLAEYAVLEQGKRKDARTIVYKELLKANPDKTILSFAENAQLNDMFHELNRNPLAVDFQANATEIETSYFWIDEVTGIECKCRPDMIIDLNGKPAVIDLKTTKDASCMGFGKALDLYNYDLQAAHYLEGLKQNGIVAESYWYILVEKEPPYLNAVRQLDPCVIDVGECKRRKALDTLKKCRESGIWGGYRNDMVSYTDYKWKRLN